jgi:carboxyl-terminal processing protease
VLDLRQNPGGYVTAADSVTSEFVRSGIDVALVYRDGKREEHAVTGKGRAFDQRLVVLVDGGSASASEIVAGALRDHKRATLVGQKTYGKGSVQEDFGVRNGGNLHLTVAYYYTPSGQLLEHNGLTPDTVVALPTEDLFYQVDLAGSDPAKDPQLQAALAALK